MNKYTGIKLLMWLTSKLPLRVINDGEKPYLERYYLFSILGWQFYIHRFVASDPDRGKHDHPWSKAYSIILWGYYWEERRDGVRKVSWFNSLVGDNFHRVILPDLLSVADGRKFSEQQCWTLFFHKAGDVKGWGFLRPVNELLPGEKDTNVPMLYTPYDYKREGNIHRWWLTAKRRGEV